MEFRDLKAQYGALKPAVDGAVASVLSSGRFIGGAPVAQLEGALARYVGVAHCLTCANGTDALELALLAWGVGEGDAVFVPDFTFFSSGEVVPLTGATPVFVDVDPVTFNLAPASLARAVAWVRDNTELAPRAVVAVDLFGLPADLPVIREICDAESMLLLEDGAQGFGGRIGEARACSFGDISTTSFFPAKPLGCYGDGGAVFTDDDGWSALMRSIAVHGKGTMKYDNVRLGMNSRLDTLQAAVLQVKLAAFEDHEVEDVNRAAAAYEGALAPLADRGWELPLVPDGFTSSWAQYTVKVPEGADRGALQEALKAQGVPTMVYYPRPMHEQPAFDGLGLCPDGCPVTVELCRRVLSLPMGPYMGGSDVERVAAALKAL
ncbi:DegT/DnrJ/EryC1/StrS family aminotransferase [Atopobiaceae bacterium 24-176]